MSDLTDRLREHCQCDEGEFCTHCEAARVLDAIDALHRPTTNVYPPQCLHDWVRWPCRTHLLLHPEKATQYPGANGGIGRFERHFVADETTRNEADQ